MLLSAGSKAKTTMTASFSLNFFLELFLGLSLKKLWMLINTLQIIVHLPLLGVELPANVKFCFNSLINISNLEILPDSWKNAIFGSLSS